MHDMAMAMAMSMVIPVAVVVAVVMDGSEIHTFHPPSYSINLAYGMYYAAMLIQDDESIIEGKHEHSNHRPNSGPTIHHIYSFVLPDFSNGIYYLLYRYTAHPTHGLAVVLCKIGIELHSYWRRGNKLPNPYHTIS
eukprot:856413_1